MHSAPPPNLCKAWLPSARFENTRGLAGSIESSVATRRNSAVRHRSFVVQDIGGRYAGSIFQINRHILGERLDYFQLFRTFRQTSLFHPYLPKKCHKKLESDIISALFEHFSLTDVNMESNWHEIRLQLWKHWKHSQNCRLPSATARRLSLQEISICCGSVLQQVHTSSCALSNVLMGLEFAFCCRWMSLVKLLTATCTLQRTRSLGLEDSSRRSDEEFIITQYTKYLMKVGTAYRILCDHWSIVILGV